MSLLARLGAIDGGRVTETGRLMQRLPLHPRLARVLLAANGSFEGCAACGVAVGARAARSAAIDIMRSPANHRSLASGAPAFTPVGAESRAGGQAAARRSSSRARRRDNAPPGAARRLPRSRGQASRLGDRVTLATGHGAVIGRESGVHDADWLVALDVTSGRTSATTQALIRVASRIEAEWLAPTRAEVIHELDTDSGIVKAREVDWYDAVVLHEHPVAPDEDRRRRAVGRSVARAPARRAEPAVASADRICRSGPEDGRPGACGGAHDARRLSDLVLTEDALPWDARQRLQRDAPPSLAVPSGRKHDDRVSATAAPSSVSVKLQELFGLAETPRIGPSKTPITFHLLAPNGRPVQTTQDLKSFWERTYPEVRKELRGRYPKHPWPEDPWRATPTHRSTKGAARAAK